jgi:hypothetical protein
VTKHADDPSNDASTQSPQGGELDDDTVRGRGYAPLLFILCGVAVAAIGSGSDQIVPRFTVPLVAVSFILYVIGSILLIQSTWTAVTTEQLSLRDFHGSGTIGCSGYLAYYLTSGKIGGFAMAFLIISLIAIIGYIVIGTFAVAKIGGSSLSNSR